MQSKLTALIVAGAFVATACQAAGDPQLTQAELNDFYRQAADISETCDVPVTTAGERLTQHDVAGAAPLVAQARVACLQAAMELGSLEFPASATGEVREKMGGFRAACSSTYALKARLMGMLIDGQSGQIKMTPGFMREGALVLQSQQDCQNAVRAIATAAGLQFPG